VKPPANHGVAAFTFQDNSKPKYSLI